MQNVVNVGDPKPSSTLSKSNEKKTIAFFCLLAAIHVFVFSAAFPFFNNVDEPMHFDLVVKYSHGQVPRGEEMISPDSATYIALFSSCAYFGTPDKFPGGKMPSPPWTVPAEQMRHDLALNSTAWQSLENYEVSQAPLYYILTGSLWHLGQRLNVDSAHLLYWLRFVNVCLVFALAVLKTGRNFWCSRFWFRPWLHQKLPRTGRRSPIHSTGFTCPKRTQIPA